MKRTIMLLNLIAAMCLSAAEVADPAAVSQEKPALPLRAFATRPGAVYKVGEPIKFRVLHYDQRGQLVPDKEISYTLSGDGGLKKEGVVGSGEELEIVMQRPGFVMVNFFYHENGRKYEMDAGAAVEPLKIQAGTPEPEDFDAYWAEQLQAMRQREKKITVRDAPEFLTGSLEGKVYTYDVRIEDGELNTTGILAVPANAPEASLPAIITFGGASWIGVRTSFVSRAVTYNALVFHMNIHDSENFIRDEVMLREVRRRPEINNYARKDADNKESYRVRNVFLRVIRALDYLKSRPEWNRKDLIAWGPSFGGAQAMVAAALDQDVTLCVAGAPAMCDHLAENRRQTPGWPRIMEYYRQRKATPELMMKVRENMPYFDMVNFAGRINCETIMAVGFIDRICFPNSIYAAFNNLAAKNKIINDVPQGNHGGNYNFSEDKIPGAFGHGTKRIREICKPQGVLK